MPIEIINTSLHLMPLSSAHSINKRHGFNSSKCGIVCSFKNCAFNLFNIIL